MSSIDSKPKNAASAVIRLATEHDAEQIAAIYAPNVTRHDPLFRV
jgi:L-amino acid N-acyltransferase YncA